MFIFRAAEWNLDNPAWTGRLRAVSKAKDLQLKLEDRNTGKTQQFFLVATVQVMISLCGMAG